LRFLRLRTTETKEHPMTEPELEPTGAMLDDFARRTVDQTDADLMAWGTDSWNRYVDVRQEQYRREHDLPPPEDLAYLDDDDLADRAGQYRFAWILLRMELARRHRLLEQLDAELALTKEDE
jgi:hypothetical protein